MWVLHVDLDEFIAAVEVRRRPELAGLPVVVGGRGDPTERGVVATASYAARAFGVGSGTPLRVAARRLPPETVYLPVDKPTYEAAGDEVVAVLRSLPVVVEVLGWDESFLGPVPDAAGEDADPELLASRVREEVLARTGLHCSVGIGDNKLQAKIATSFGKPRGVGRLTSAEWDAVMGPRPTDALWGIGSKTSKRLAALGITTVAELAATETTALADAFGPRTGPWLRRLGRGVDSSPVDPTPWVPRGHGRETTFQADLEDPVLVAEQVRRLAHEVAADLAREGRPATRVGLKLRSSGFRTVQRSLTLPEPSGDPDVLADAAVALLDRFGDARPRAVRLVGVRAEMTSPDGG